MTKIYLISNSDGDPIFVETRKDKVVEFCGERLEKCEDSHFQLWENGKMTYENWVTGNLLLKLDNNYPLTSSF